MKKYLRQIQHWLQWTVSSKYRRDYRIAKNLVTILRPLLRNAPIDKIERGESCSWDMTKPDSDETLRAVQAYVKN